MKVHNYIFSAVIPLFFIFIISCSKEGDPISYVKFGDVSVNGFKSKFKEEGLLEAVNIQDEDYDSITYFYLDGDPNLKTTLWENPDGYEFDNFYSAKLNFGSDSIMFFDKKIFRPGKGEISEFKLNRIINLYKKWYGEPNLSFLNSMHHSEISKVIALYEKSQQKSLKGKLANSISARSGKNYFIIWELEMYNVMISYRSNFADSSFNNGFIKYEALNYDKIIDQKKEDIRANASLNDYIYMNLNLNTFTQGQPPFTDRLNLYIYSLRHNLPEESRNIRKFKFDVMFEDEYGDLILKINDIDFDPDSPLKSPIDGLIFTKSGGYTIFMDFNKTHEKYKDFEKLRKLRERKISNGNFDDIKIKYKVTSLIFEDGEVLK
ncbi:hypothetical protein QWY93_15835 [Echinicola jeungdonensis]|uniref:Lipoprotein n=1 Tax=Echinicola jeungdonensis TaxID=709343 RepID=A0ABV5J6W6_9BACT|nr:hypothetical protein [Echinicola jeungdonensis]MDN3670791.1 hypothetical protein [Echinicola jeungdonensis]